MKLDVPIDMQGLAISVSGITTAKIAVFLIRQLYSILRKVQFAGYFTCNLQNRLAICKLQVDF